MGRTYPCINCSKSVTNKQNAILCIACKKWIHLNCSSLGYDFFHSDADWICDICLYKELPFHDADIPNDTDEHPNTVVQYDSITKIYQNLNNFKGLSIGHLNICTLLRNVDEIHAILDNSKLDILTLSETRLDGYISDSELFISGYNFIRLDRNRHGGGVAMYIRDNILYEMQEQFMGELELICIKIVIDKQKPFFLVTWYRPPDSHKDIFVKFESFLQYLDSCGLDFFILGDLNCDVSRTPHHCHTKRLFSLASNYNMKQFIVKPTRVTAYPSTTIDLLFSSNSNRVQFCDVVPITVSDHFMIIASLGKIKPPPSQHKYVTYRDFKKMDSSAFYNDLDNLSWSAVLSETDAEIAYNKLISIYKDVLNVHAPIKRKRIRKKSAPWINEQILTMMKERDASKEKARLTGDPQDWCKYKQLRNRVTAKRRKFKREYVTRTILENTGNSGEIWKLLGKILPSNKKHDSLKSLNINGRDITDSKEIADYMNDYFANITKKLKDTAQFEKNNLTAASTNCLSEFSFESVTSSHVLKCLNEIPKKKSAGLDGIPTFILKDSASYIIRPLLHIINISLSQGRVPSGWKVAKLTPLYKGGSFKDPTNYRPISVLPVLSKVMEKVVFKQVYKYITDNNLLSDNQFGFRPGYSTNTALFTITENIRKKVDQGYVVGLVTLDLKKAFDMVSHEILLYKLKNFGFDDLSVSWFRDYLSFRKHTTNINNNLSDFCPVTCGVPQGSILGPLLFIIFINDISKVVKFSNISMYADDTCIYYASDNSNDLCSCLNEDLCKLSKWLKCNELLLNPKKCEFITFGSHRKLLSFANAHIHIDGERINRVQECKYSFEFVSQLECTDQIC